MAKEKPKIKKATKETRFHLEKKATNFFLSEVSRPGKSNPNLKNAFKKYRKQVQESDTSPFIHEGPVEGDDFLNHRKELKHISNQLLKPCIAFVSAYSGFGNTSFAKALRKELERKSNAAVIYSDVNYCRTEIQFMNSYVRDVSDALGHTQPHQTIAYGTHDREDIVKFPQELAERHKKRIILILDNFDCISSMSNAKEFMNFLVSIWLNQKSISVCIFSETYHDYLSETIMKGSNHLYKLVIFETLKIIPEKMWYSHLLKKFKKNKRTINEKTATYLVTKMNNVPRYIQFLAHDLFVTQSIEITTDLIDETINRIIDDGRYLYDARLKRLTKLQRQVLDGYLNDVPVQIPKHLINRTLDALYGIVYRYSHQPKLINPFVQIYLERKQ